MTAKDINNDGILELPDPYALPDSGSTSIAVNFWAIRWRQYDINGNSHPVFTTYYNDQDGWYFILPEAWDGKITLSRNDVAGGGERAVIFSYWEGDASVDPAPFLIIYTLRGDNRFCGPICREDSACLRAMTTAIPSMPPASFRTAGTVGWMRAV